ncbi:MAG: PorT family protein [Taibaiella sp.]|nr:PorT family protein [Taibaiella sp.]
MTRLIIAALFLGSAFSFNKSFANPPKKYIPKVVAGVKGGVNLQQISGDGSAAQFDAAYKPGILGGIFLGVDKKKSGFRGEALLKTCRYALSGSTVKLKTVNVDIPLMYEHKLVKRVWFQVGPQFSMLLSAKQTNGVDFKNSMRNTDVSVVAGLEGILPAKLTVGARYVKGFVNANNTASPNLLPGKWTNSAIQISVGYRFVN